MVIPLFVGRERSIRAFEQQWLPISRFCWSLSVMPHTTIRRELDLYDVGTVATILQLLKLPDGTVKVLVEGGARATLLSFIDEPNCFSAAVDIAPDSEGQDKEIRGSGANVDEAI